MASRADMLRKLPLFAGLPKGDCELIARYMDELDFAAGSTLIREGQSNHTFFIVADGEAEVTVAGEPRRRIQRGDFFGEISMQHRIPATATVVATADLSVFVMSHEQFGALSTSPDVLARLNTAMSDRLAHDRMLAG
jgi:CRP-like cAMP-binding protein